MTKREAVVIETYTGVCMLAGEDRGLAYKYAEELLGFPVHTHMFADKEIQAQLRERSKPEFLEICQRVKNDGWIPCSERMPELRKDCLVTVKYSGFMGMCGTWIKTGHLESEDDWWGDCCGGKVIAWTPLPEPYKGE